MEGFGSGKAVPLICIYTSLPWQPYKSARSTAKTFDVHIQHCRPGRLYSWDARNTQSSLLGGSIHTIITAGRLYTHNHHCWEALYTQSSLLGGSIHTIITAGRLYTHNHHCWEALYTQSALLGCSRHTISTAGMFQTHIQHCRDA